MLSSVRTFGPHLTGPKFPRAFFNPSKTFHGATPAPYSQLSGMKQTTTILMGHNKSYAILGGQQQIWFHSFNVVAERSERFQRMANASQYDKVVVKLEQDEDGQKYLTIMGLAAIKAFFPKFCVPEDVDELVQAWTRCWPLLRPTKRQLTNTQDRLLVGRVDVKAKQFDYQLDLKVFNAVVEVEMRTVPNEVQPKRWVNLPLRQFHWVRQAIGQVLAEAGEQQLPEPPKVPEWLNYYSIPHSKEASSFYY